MLRAEMMKRVTLGLVGKSPTVLLDDAVLDQGIPTDHTIAFLKESQMSRRRKIVRKMLSRRRQLIARRIETLRNIQSNPPDEEIRAC